LCQDKDKSSKKQNFRGVPCYHKTGQPNKSTVSTDLPK